MMSNLSFKTLMYALDVCMTVCRQMHVCQEDTCQIWITCMQIVSQGQQNYLYVHVHAGDSSHDTNINPAKNSNCKDKAIRSVCFTNYHW